MLLHRGILSLLLIVLALSTPCASAIPSAGLIQINLTLSTNLTVLSDIIDITVLKEMEPTYQPDTPSIKGESTDRWENTGIEEPSIWSKEENGVIHTYKAVIAPGITWTHALDAAIAEGGHLATITSSEENDLVFSHIQSRSYWSLCRGNMFGPWIGGMHPSGPHHAHTGWTWVTGERWEYTMWASEEPNDYLGEEDRLFFYSGTCTPAPTWGDHRNDGDGNVAYIIEWEIPIYPSRLALLPTNHWIYGEKIPRNPASSGLPEPSEELKGPLSL